MRTLQDASAGSLRRRARAFVLPIVLAFIAPVSRPQAASGGVQVSFEQASADLTSPDAKVRLRAVQLLKGAMYPEAALPLVPLLTDAQDEIQLEAIAAELNIFLADPIVPKTRKALIVEVRNAVQAEPAFSAGVVCRSKCSPGCDPQRATTILASRSKRCTRSARWPFSRLVTPGAHCCAPPDRTSPRSSGRQIPRCAMQPFA